MNKLPLQPSESVQMTPRLSQFSVNFRLRLLLVTLITMLLCSAGLIWINWQHSSITQQVNSRVNLAIGAMNAAEQAKNSLLDLRRALTLAAMASEHTEPGTMESVIESQSASVTAAAQSLNRFDPTAALRLSAAAESLNMAAAAAAVELAAGNAGPKSLRFLHQFPQLTASAETSIDALLTRKRQELQKHIEIVDSLQIRLQRQALALQGLLLLLSIAGASIVCRALFRPLGRLYSALRTISRGEPLSAPPVTGTDEFGQLGNALHSLSQMTTQLNQLAYQDSLTGLPNRSRFEQDLANTLGRNERFALLFTDIDHFRIINDGYGHFFGDQVLKAVAERLRWLTQGNTRIYRYSGDLFAIFIESGGPFPAEGFRSLMADEAERLRLRMTDPLSVEGRSISLSLSFSAALHPDDGDKVETLVSAADAAMFHAKKLGRNVVQFARNDSASNARLRLELSDDLRQALKTGAINPHFQPIVDLGSGRVTCVEALARWHHPVNGWVPPENFIAVAEESGQIDLLTERLLLEACTAAAQWPTIQGHPAPRLAFNLSARQVREGVVEMIARALAATKFPAERLEVEITESAIIEQPEVAESLLRKIKALGVSVALDDFGTGYSSLSYLLRFPIDKIKVDKSFVQQLNGQKQAGKIVAATISLARNLEVELVAEGVENIGQMTTLFELGCRMQQGWLFSQALPASDFLGWAQNAPLKLAAVVRSQAEDAENSPRTAPSDSHH